MAAAFGIAFWMDSRFPKAPPWDMPMAILSIVIAVAVAAFSGTLDLVLGVRGMEQWLALGTVFLASRYVITAVPDQLESGCDAARNPLNGTRIRFSLTLIALTVLVSVWAGQVGAVLPAWVGLAVMLGFNVRDMAQ